jgi:hypothetical protein
MPVEKAKAKDEPTYAILDFPRQARELLASRSPRIQASAIEEFGDMISSEVQRAMWITNPENGTALRSTGETLVDYAELVISTRPHWAVPLAKALPEQELEAMYASGDMTARSRRYAELKAFYGSDAGAHAVFYEEAARFGITDPFRQKTGTKPDERTETKTDAASLSTNPWSINFHGDIAARDARIASVLKVKGKEGGTWLANQLCKAAGTKLHLPLGGTRK